MTTAPDVSVVVAVYNTMPYLTECLNSLVGQSIGLDRLEIVAVDDGSTDDSGKELDRFAERYPDTIKVIHQANSGGPAAPSNRALEVATGRYVYFIGSDDYLGSEALERMVTTADESDSDVVIGKMVGVNGRGVHKELFKVDRKEVTLYDSTLPWAASNTKLFRRELIERHGLRYPEDLPVGSDQPFTIEALVHARRTTVLGDYDYYYAVRRGDAGNITYRADHEIRLQCTATIMDFVAGLLEPGPRRDAVLRRHFAAELWKLLQQDFLDLDPAVQRDICHGVGRLADKYLTDTIRNGLPVKRRLRLHVAQSGDLDALREIINYVDVPPIVLGGERAYMRYPGFRDARLSVPDRCFEIIDEKPTGQIAKGTRAVSVAWVEGGDRRPELSIVVRTALLSAQKSTAIPVSFRLVNSAMPKSAYKTGARRLPREHELPMAVGQVSQATESAGTDTVVRVRIPVKSLLSLDSHGTAPCEVRLYADVAGSIYEIPLSSVDPARQKRVWHRARLYRITANANKRGHLVIAVRPIRPHQILRRRLRRLVTSTRRK